MNAYHFLKIKYSASSLATVTTIVATPRRTTLISKQERKKQ